MLFHCDNCNDGNFKQMRFLGNWFNLQISTPIRQFNALLYLSHPIMRCNTDGKIKYANFIIFAGILSNRKCENFQLISLFRIKLQYK